VQISLIIFNKVVFTVIILDKALFTLIIFNKGVLPQALKQQILVAATSDGNLRRRNFLFLNCNTHQNRKSLNPHRVCIRALKVMQQHLII
jgi:hypothetical protein